MRRAILLRIEAATPSKDREVPLVDFEGWSNEEVEYHVGTLWDDRLIKGYNETPVGGPRHFRVTGLKAEGHRYLQQIREDETELQLSVSPTEQNSTAVLKAIYEISGGDLYTSAEDTAIAQRTNLTARKVEDSLSLLKNRGLIEISSGGEFCEAYLTSQGRMTLEDPNFRITQNNPIQMNVTNNTTHLTVNAPVGLVNMGQIENVKAINISLAQLQDADKVTIAEAFKNLTDAVIADKELKESEKSSVIEDLRDLSKQAALPPEERLTGRTLKMITESIETTLNTIDKLATFWAKWGAIIVSAVGLAHPAK